MNRKTITFMLFLILTSALAIRAQSDLSESTINILPRNEILDGKLGEEYIQGLTFPWDCRPELYGFTDPPQGKFRFPSEYESTTGIYIGWPAGSGCLFPELTELVRIGLNQGVEVVIPTINSTIVENCLRSRGIADEQIEKITFATMPIDTIWGRDYGPEVMIADESPNQSTRYGIDMSYYPSAWVNCVPNPQRDRVNDDASPTRLAGKAIYDSVFRPQFRHEGGNIQTDGNGTCFSSDRALFYNRWVAWTYEVKDLERIYNDYLGCDRLVILERLAGELTQHIDMWMTVISSDTIIVNKYDRDDDPHPEIERNVKLLESLGYKVVRIPSVPKYCIDSRRSSCVGNPDSIQTCDQPFSRRVWATHANSIRIGNAVAVPVYKDVPDELRDDVEAREAEALATFARELPGVEVVPVKSDFIIPCEGAIHCVDITYK